MSDSKEELFSEEDSSDEDVVDVEPKEKETRPAPTPDAENSLVKPVANVEEVAEVYNQFEEVKQKLLTDDDKQSIGSGKSKSTFITKSGWRKIATAFNVSVDIVEKKKTVTDGVVTWAVKARATAPNGKTTEAHGVCASNESNHMELLSKKDSDWSESDDDVMKVDGKWRRLKPPVAVNEHDILATAETRAKNRAISDLVGGGSVSAEEVSKESVLE